MEVEIWKTPRSFFSKATQLAADKYDCSGSLFTFTEKELNALNSNPHFHETIEIERDRRKAAAEAEAAWRKTQVAAAVAAPKLSTKQQEQLIDDLHAAVIAGIDTGEPSPLIEFLEKQTSNVHGTLVSVVLGLLATHCFRLREKRRELEARVEKLEQSPAKAAGAAVRYRGIWVGTEAFDAGDLTTHKGGLWCAKTSSLCKRPGTDSEHWQLIVKSGQAE
jgi:hypothetical protein